MRILDRVRRPARQLLGRAYARRLAANPGYVVDDTSDGLALAHRIGRFTFEVPVEVVTWPGAFAYAAGWHPYVRALDQGRAALEAFYARYQPTTVGARYLIEEDLPGLDGPAVNDPPWLWRGAFLDPRTPALHLEELRKYVGPASTEVVDREWGRLEAIARSIREAGYQPERHEGPIRGYFLRLGDDQRFVVTAGQHRAAALVSLGWERLPVAFQTDFPRVVRWEDAAAFPQVRSGAFSIEAAQAVLRRYFELDGREQLGGPVAEASPAPVTDAS